MSTEFRVPDDVEDLPPSCKLVTAALTTADRPLTHADLQERTLLPSRSLQYAIRRLREDTNILQDAVHLPDPRAKEYSLDV
jgi:hypothetical protein